MLFEFFQKPLGWAVCALIGLLLLWGGYSLLTRDARTEARLGRNQAESALESGKDAVNTVGAASDRESASNDLTRTNESEIRNAEGADAAVATPVREAGIEALCRRTAYRDSPRCLNRVRE